MSTATVSSQRRIAPVNFVICNECFWCASLLGARSINDGCPSCHKNALETVPVSSNEKYAFDYSPTGGAVLEFSPVQARAVQSA
ncbi:MAG TPA: hypothetical protein VF016_04890 [Nitrososphaera sp.]